MNVPLSEAADAATSVDAATVAAYLRAHPDFLADTPELAAHLTLPRAQGGVASFGSYRVQQLRERNAELERRLAELVAIAADNEKLMERVHTLTVALLRANTLEVVTRTVMARLSADFHSERVRLLLFGHNPELPRSDWLCQVGGGASELPELADLLRRAEPTSGRLGADKLACLFGAEAADIHSAAVLPLGDSGVLAIGSHDEHRFQPGMGTLFLKMIAATVTAALARARDLA
ncbi:MAG TPA: DUF484 family protein [Rhodanobacter sp.]|nr:DUF484 family protein [Rhodanobacter sp.]